MPKSKSLTVKQNSPVVNQNTQPNLASRILSYAGKFGVISVGLAASQLPGATGFNASPTPTPTLATTQNPWFEGNGNGFTPIAAIGVVVMAVVSVSLFVACAMRAHAKKAYERKSAQLVLIPPPRVQTAAAITPTPETIEEVPGYVPQVVRNSPILTRTQVTVEATIEAPPQEVVIETPPPKPPRTNHIGTITKSFEEWRAEDTPAANKVGDATRAAYQVAKEAVAFVSAPDSEKVMDPHAHKHAHEHEITAPLLLEVAEPTSDASSASELSAEPGPEQVIPAAEQVDTVVVAPQPYVLPQIEIKPIPRPRSTASELSLSSTQSRPVRLVTSLLSKDVQESLKYILASEKNNPSKKPLYDV